jgi:hypothetical protein
MNQTNEQIIDGLLEQYQEQGGDIAELYERNDFSHMTIEDIITTLQDEIDDLQDDDPDDYSPDYPIGGMAEPYDIDKEK